jgi:hypothetical protein
LSGDNTTRDPLLTFADQHLISSPLPAEKHEAMVNSNVRVILTEPDQTAISGFWVYGGDRPSIGQVIPVESALGAGSHQAEVWRIVSGEPYLLYATKLATSPLTAS